MQRCWEEHPSWGGLSIPGQDLPVWVCTMGLTSPFQISFGFKLACVCSHLYLSFLLNCFVFFTINLALIKVCGFQKRVCPQKGFAACIWPQSKTKLIRNHLFMSLASTGKLFEVKICPQCVLPSVWVRSSTAALFLGGPVGKR